MRFIYNLLRYKLYKSPLRNCRYFSTANSNLINVTFITNDDQVEVTIPTGTSILEAAHQNNIELEGACDGCMACSTCHVILDEEVYDSLPEPSESELDMLDLAPCLTPTSRLGCQVILNEEHNGIKVQLPKITRNFYVDGYTPQPH